MKVRDSLKRLPARGRPAFCLLALALFLVLPALHRAEHGHGRCRGGALEHACARLGAGGEGLSIGEPVRDCPSCEVISSSRAAPGSAAPWFGGTAGREITPRRPPRPERARRRLPPARAPPALRLPCG